MRRYFMKKKITGVDTNIGSSSFISDIKDKEVSEIKAKYLKIAKYLKDQGLLKKGEKIPNTVALNCAEKVYSKSNVNIVKNAIGSNIGPATIRTLQDSKFFFPENCIFYSKDISEINVQLLDKKFDLILLDPPWWNKYIRRKRKKSPDAYNMMYNTDLKSIPIEKMLTETGIVVVWCTNSSQHLHDLTQNIFPKWGVKFVAKWYWVKITTLGDPICEFSEPPGKQPFEQIIFGYRNPSKCLPDSGKLLISVPSAIHSSKPPLVEVIQNLLPENPQCLEIFARYLLPNWTSYGNEVLKFQNECLYLSQ
ncbi:methyltransferase like 4 isoform X2 [Rhynchophorus ferrugineus]